MSQVRCNLAKVLQLQLVLAAVVAASVTANPTTTTTTTSKPPSDHHGRLKEQAQAACGAVDWWKKTTYYQIYVRSFQDSDGDGNGDLMGILSRLDYLQSIGVETLLLSSIYQSPMKDGNYDVSDHFAFHTMYGDRFDFTKLLTAVHDRKMRLIVDFVPNHTSNESRLFQWSQRAYEDVGNTRNSQYKDFYVWVKPRLNASGEPDLSKPPNNWVSVFGNEPRSAWTFSPVRKEWYYHQYLPEQPDLNFRNPEVRTMLKNAARSWLTFGVDGLRVASVSHLYESKRLLDEPVNPNWNSQEDSPYDSLIHDHTRSLKESFAAIDDWRDLVNEPVFVDPETGKSTKVIIVESYDRTSQMIKAYGAPDDRWADMVYNYELLNGVHQMNWSPKEIERAALRCLQPVKDLHWPQDPDGTRMPWTNWVTGNHDTPRLVNRVGSHNAVVYQWISFMLPGVPVNYAGDELLIENANYTHISQSTVREGEASRLMCRVPMAWDASRPAGGFTSNATYTWMPLNSNYEQNNVATLIKPKSANNRTTHNPLKAFMQMAEIRKQYLPIFLFGDLVFFETGTVYNKNSSNSDSGRLGQVLALARKTREYNNLLLLANTATNENAFVRLRATKSFYEETLTEPPKMAKVLAVSRGTGELKDGSRVQIDELVSLDKLVLLPSQGMVLKFGRSD